MSQWLNNIALKGDMVELNPLERSHRSELLEAAADGKLWELWYTSVPSKDNIDDYINKAIKDKENGNAYPFVIIDRTSDKIIGSTRYCNVETQHKRVEIGYTWYAKSFQRTRANTECKYLMLQYAFEELNCICVQFLTNWYNLKSREAILRLGAKQDGILRNHRLNPDGSYRDTVIFSITDQEWFSVKKSLALKLK